MISIKKYLYTLVFAFVLIILPSYTVKAVDLSECEYRYPLDVSEYEFYPFMDELCDHIRQEAYERKIKPPDYKEDIILDNWNVVRVSRDILDAYETHQDLMLAIYAGIRKDIAGDERSGYYFECETYVFRTTIIWSDNVYLLCYQMSFRTTLEEEQAVDIAFEEFYQNIPENARKKDILKTVHKFATGKIKYDHYAAIWDDEGDALYHNDLCTAEEYFHAHTGYGALVNKKAVCQGVAAMESRILKHYDIKILPILSTDAKHVWLAVKNKGKWYMMDDVWNYGKKWYFTKEITDSLRNHSIMENPPYYNIDDIKKMKWYIGQ